MITKYSELLYPPIIGDIIKVVPDGLTNTIGSIDDIKVTFYAKITKVSETGNIEEIEITESPEFVRFENKIIEKNFNEQFSVGKLINANNVLSKNFICELTDRTVLIPNRIENEN